MSALSKSKRFLEVSTPDYPSLLRHLAKVKSLKTTTQLHAHATTTAAVLPLLPGLIQLYFLSGHGQYARKLFDGTPKRSSFLYNTMMKLYISKNSPFDALLSFTQMLELGQCRPDEFTTSLVLKGCGELGFLKFGRSVHGSVFKVGLDKNMFVQNNLVAMYMSCGAKEAAIWVFDAMEERSVVTWNTMVSGYFRNGCAQETVGVFYRMMDEGVDFDRVTVISLLPACAFLKDLEVGRRVHRMVEERGMGGKIEVGNSLVDMYVKCNCMEEARRVFDGMEERDVVTWTAIINGYILNGGTRTALAFCGFMQVEGVRPNSVTLASLLSACATLKYLKDGQCLHGWALRQKLDYDVIVETALIDMYAKCNFVDSSFRVFSKSSRKTTTSWNAIFAGCVHNKLARKAIEYFKLMMKEGVETDAATMSSLLPAYALLADLQQAENIHSYLIGSGFLSQIIVATGLVDIYSKCGNLVSAHTVFNCIPEKEKDIICWSTIVAGYGMHGYGEVALSLFNQMVLSGVKPNEVTFTSVLHACSHAGLVDEGLSLFKFMLDAHAMYLCSDHYSCMVDLLGRAGRLEEAYDLITTMLNPNHSVWGALLGACVIHENVELGEVAAKWLFELEPENTGNYVLLARIYAAVGRWKDAEYVRYMMNQIGLKKSQAHSSIEVRNM